jgi:hypothetical protein
MRGGLGDGGIVMQGTTPNSKRSAACVGLFASVFLATASLADENKPPIQLPDGGQVVSKFENQVLSKACRAKREWVEVVGIPEPTAARLINAHIRKEITVGRKLRDANCPGPEDDETYEYMNSVEVSGVWHRFLGTQTNICFPGGTGRCVLSCEVFDLQTGHRDDLNRHVESSARRALDALLNKQAETDKFPIGYLPLKSKEAAICLDSKGIRVVYVNDSGSATTSVTIDPAQISKYFRLPTDLASDLSNPGNKAAP